MAPWDEDDNKNDDLKKKMSVNEGIQLIAGILQSENYTKVHTFSKGLSLTEGTATITFFEPKWVCF